MTVLELHPEELLDRARKGPLSESEQEVVDRHLEHCEACQLLREARDDFHTERLEWGPERYETLLLAPTLKQELERHVQGSRQRPGDSRVPRRAVNQRARALALALALMGSAAAASSVATGWFVQRQSSPATKAALRPTEPPAAKVPTSRTQLRTPTTSPLAPLPLESANTTPPDRPPPSPVGTKAFSSAAELLEQATQARVEGRYSAALKLYQKLEQRYPRSMEARASGAMVGRLLLDTGRPEAALSFLERPLAEQPPALTEEVLVARAVAYERLGRRAEARDAWLAFLRAHPGSIHATRARTRLESLALETRE